MGSKFLFIEIFLTIFLIFMGVSWVVNLVKLTDCDFEKPYKCEIVHAVRIIPVAAIFTAWTDFEK